jgi:hypothetical protein
MVGSAGLLLAAASALTRLRPKAAPGLHAPAWYPGLGPACLVAAGLYLLSFARLPLEFAYLIPLVPFVLLGTFRYSAAWASRTAMLLLLVAPFALHLGFWGETSLSGPVLVDARRKAEQLASIEAVHRHIAALPPGRLVVAGPEINRLRGGPPPGPGTPGTRDVRWENELTPEGQRAALQNGENVYLLVKERHLYRAAYLLTVSADGQIRTRLDTF